jgi:hypothetical protein
VGNFISCPKRRTWVEDVLEQCAQENIRICEEAVVAYRKLHNEELNLFYSTHILRVIKSRRM